MNDELEPEALAFLHAADRQRVVPAGGVERNWEAIQARIAGAPTSSSSPRAGWIPRGAIHGVVALIGIGVLASWPWTRDPDAREPTVATSSASATFESPVSVPQQQPAPPPLVAPPREPSASQPIPATPSVAVERRAGPVAPRKAAKATRIDRPTIPESLLQPPPAAATGSHAAVSTADEVDLLAQAKAAIDTGEFERALGLLARHERDFADGMLVEERLAGEVVALCGLGRYQAAGALRKRFERAYPRSPARARVASACAGSGPAPTRMGDG